MKRSPLKRKVPAFPKPRASLPRQSKKRAKLNREYAKLRKAFLTEHPICQALYMVCTGNAKHVHHMAGRGKNLNNVATWLAVCPQCHDEIHQHPYSARVLGFLV